MIEIWFHFQCFLVSLLCFKILFFHLFAGTQGEAVNAYDIDVITIRGLNAVTNFDVSSYDVHNILLNITLTIFVAAKRFKDAEHVEMTIDGHMTVDEISS